MFKHFIITRFNLTNPDWTTTKNNEPLLTDEWMENRLWLFENFCFPSVANQSSDNFRWVIFADTVTKAEHKAHLERLTDSMSFIDLIFIDGMSKFKSSIDDYVKAHCQRISHLITSRIDNDDCIHKDFVKEIQQCFDHQSYLIIDVLKGYSLQIKPTYMLGKKQHIFNPFMSLIEKNEHPKTIWSNDHMAWKKESRIKFYTKKRLWVAIIHAKNKINNFNGYGNVPWKELETDFMIKPSMSKILNHELIPETKWKQLSIKNAIIVNYKVASKLFKKSLGFYKLKS